MDIRKFLRKRSLEEEDERKSKRTKTSNSMDSIMPNTDNKCTPCSVCPKANEDISPEPHPLDVGNFINATINDDQKYELLMNTYVPPPTYDYKQDSLGKRSFRHSWLDQYSPWLVYSPYLKGPICKYCVIFKPVVHRGFQGSFIIRPFVKFKDFNEHAKNHASCGWHRESVELATSSERDKVQQKMLFGS